MAPPASGNVAVVTDSTAYLPADLASRYGIGVVPLHVVIGGVSGAEGVDVTPADVARALRERTAVTTSRPAPGDLAAAYRSALVGGARAVLSVHLARELSGTYESAQLAAADLPPGAVCVLDSRSAGMGLGFVVLAAAEAATAGGDLATLRAVVEDTVARTTTLFCPDTLEHLRRGGRIGAAAALVGTALSVKPILRLVDGRVALREKVRTAARGLARLEELAVEVGGDGPSDVAVHHLAAPERAAALAERLRARMPHARDTVLAELGAAVGAHLGPGVLGVVIVRR